MWRSRASAAVLLLVSFFLLSAGMHSSKGDDEPAKHDDIAHMEGGEESAVNMVRVPGPDPIYALPGIDMFRMGVDAVTGKFAQHTLFQYYYPLPHIWGYTEEENEKNVERNSIHENTDTYMLPDGFSAHAQRTCSFDSKVTMYHYSTEYESSLAASANLDGLMGALSLEASVQRVQKTMSSHEKSLSKVSAPCVVWQVSHYQGFRMSKQFLDLLERSGLVHKTPGEAKYSNEKDSTAVDTAVDLIEEAEESGGSGSFADDMMSELSEVAAAVNRMRSSAKTGGSEAESSSGDKDSSDGEPEASSGDKESTDGEPKASSGDSKPLSGDESEPSGDTKDSASGTKPHGGDHTSESSGEAHDSSSGNTPDPQSTSGGENESPPKVDIVNLADECLSRKANRLGILLEDGSGQDSECNDFVKKCSLHRFKSEAERQMCRSYVRKVEDKFIKRSVLKPTGDDADVKTCVDDCVRGPETFFETIFKLFGTHFVSRSGLGGTVEMTKEVARNAFYERSTKSIGADLRGEFTLLMGQEASSSEVMYQVQAKMPDGTVKTYELKDQGGDTEAPKEEVKEKKLNASVGGKASTTSTKDRTHESDKVTIEVEGGVPGSLSSDGNGWGEWAATVEKAPVLVEPLYNSICTVLSTIPLYTYYNDDPETTCAVDGSGKVDCTAGDPGTQLQTYRYSWSHQENTESHALHLKRACKYRLREHVAERGRKSASVYDLYLVFGFPDEKYKNEYYSGANIYITIVGEHGILRDIPLTNYKRDKSFSFMPGRGNHFHIDNYASLGEITEIFLMLEVPGIQGEEPFEPEKPNGPLESDLTSMKTGVRLVYDEARIVDVSTGRVYFFFGSAHASQRMLLSKMASNFDPADAKKSVEHMKDIGIKSNATIADAPFPVKDLVKFTPAIQEPEADRSSVQDFYEIIVKVHDAPGSGSLSNAINLIIQGDDVSFTVQLPLQSMRVYIGDAATSAQAAQGQPSAATVPTLRQCFDPEETSDKETSAKKVTREDVSKKGKGGGFEHEAQKGYYDDLYNQMAHMKDKKTDKYRALYSQVMGCSNHGLAGNVGIYRYKNLPIGRLQSVEVDNPGRSSIRIEHIDIVHVDGNTFATTAYRARFPNKKIGTGEEGADDDEAKFARRVSSRLSEIGKPVIEEAGSTMTRELHNRQHAMAMSGGE